MMLFLTGTGLEHAGIAGPVHFLWMSGSPAKIRNNKDRRGPPVATLMPKLVLSDRREDQLLREWIFCAYLSPMGWLGIYNG